MENQNGKLNEELVDIGRLVQDGLNSILRYPAEEQNQILLNLREGIFEDRHKQMAHHKEEYERLEKSLEIIKPIK